MAAPEPVRDHGRLRPHTYPRLLAAVGLGMVVVACGPGVGDVRVANGSNLACTQERAPALRLEAKLDDDPDAERVALTYAAVVSGGESPFPGLAPMAIPVTDATMMTVQYVDERTRDSLCQQVAFDTYTQDGQRTFVVRMLRERDQETLAEGRFSIVMQP